MERDDVFHLGSLFTEGDEGTCDPKTELKEKQKRLSTIIKRAHAHLRRQLKTCRPSDTIYTLNYQYFIR